MKKKFLSILIISVMLTTVQVPVSFAAEQNCAEAAGGVIREFLPLEESEFYFEGEPQESELVASLPEEIPVVLDGDDTAVALPVSWEVVEDFDDTEYYFYSACPVWPSEYALAEDLDPLMDVPWITLFRRASEAELADGEAQLEIPVEDPENLEPVYTQEEEMEDPLTQDAGSEVSLTDVLDLLTEESYAASASDTAKIYKYLTGTMGLNMAAACAVMTNLYAESGMQSNNLENKYNALYGLSDEEYTSRVNKGKKNNGKYTSGYGKTRYFTQDYSGYGICQWTSLGRRKNLLNAAVKKDVSIANLNMQLAFLQSELEKSYPQVWATLKNVPNNANGVYLATMHFCVAFEVPANTNNTAASRAKTALSTYWKTYSGKSASVSGSSFLGLCGYTYPKNIKKGKGMNVSGHVISNYKITSATAKILNSSGKAVYSSTKKPQTTVYSLYNFDSSMLFGKLSAGTYTYQITAKDSKGKSVTAKHRFTVSAAEGQIVRGCAASDVSTSVSAAATQTGSAADPAAGGASTLRGVGLNHPKKLKKGKKFSIKGKVTSNYDLKKVEIQIRTTKGKKKQSASANLSGRKTYPVKKLDAKIRFAKLSRGKYYYIVKATDAKGTKQLLKKKFTVK